MCFPFFFNDTATTEIYTLSLHDALPIYPALLVACDLLGIDRIFRCNGVAGIAAFAVGTDSIPAMPAIVGPGNPYVVATQVMAQTLGVRMLAMLGPTERSEEHTSELQSQSNIVCRL